MEDTRKALLEKASELPLCPGVYLMHAANGSVIYVGKSKALRNRVSSYFQASVAHTYKTERMVSAVSDFEVILTDSEMEALTLENNLIKLHTPRYNIKLKDDKNYPYIRINLHDAYPSFSMVRRRADDGAKYFGPYSGTQIVFSVIRMLNRCFTLPSCRHIFPQDIGRVRPCIYAQIGHCCAPCSGSVKETEYRELVNGAMEVLHGRMATLKGELEQSMHRAAEAEEYEAAAKYRNRIRTLDALWQKQKVVASPDAEQDIFALYESELCSVVSVFTVRGGCLVDHDAAVFPKESILTEENLSSFMLGYYHTREDIPKEILVDKALNEDDADVLGSLLSEKAGYKVTVRTPQRGDAHGLCRMAFENAVEAAAQYNRQNEKDAAVLVRLASMLGLEVVPQRIEAFDISNYGNEYMTAGMVVFSDAQPKRRAYRTFRINGVTHQDDPACMREALSRRLAHIQNGDTSFSNGMPDLILLDGGEEQLSAARAAMDESGLSIPMFGMVKDAYHKTRTLTDGINEINIAKEQSVFSLIYKIQEEVHRFTVSSMTAAKRKTVRRSSLVEIQGIGEKRAKALLTHFGGRAGVARATIEELCTAPGISAKNAETVYRFFHKGNGATEKEKETT